MNVRTMNKEKKTILLVDDSLLVLERIISMLEGAENIEFVVHAGTCKEAMSVLDDLQPDYILLDIHLPDDNGMNLLKFVREKYKKMLVFMMTNQATPQYREACRQLGATRFFDKSLDFDLIPAALSA
jgi:DNA-binding NarL/FixJ family response regulator